jgi:hypothetical protein
MTDGVCELHDMCMKNIDKKIESICAQEGRCELKFRELHTRIDGMMQASTFRWFLIVAIAVLTFLCSSAIYQVKATAVLETKVDIIKTDIVTLFLETAKTTNFKHQYHKDQPQ